VGETWKMLENYYENSSDWQVTPNTPWNYGILLDPNNPENYLEFSQKPSGNFVFSQSGTPVYATAKGKIINSWNFHYNAADLPPPSPGKI
jgi:hypothetical protein